MWPLEILKGLHENKLDLTGDQAANDRLSFVPNLFEDMTTQSAQINKPLELEVCVVLPVARDREEAKRLGCRLRRTSSVVLSPRRPADLHAAIAPFVLRSQSQVSKAGAEGERGVT